MVGQHAIAAPVSGQRRRLAVLAPQLIPTALEPAAVGNGLARGRGPRADARAERARVVISPRLVLAHLLDPPLDAHLPLELLPEEREAGHGMHREVATLAAL